MNSASDLGALGPGALSIVAEIADERVCSVRVVSSRPTHLTRLFIGRSPTKYRFSPSASIRSAVCPTPSWRREPSAPRAEQRLARKAIRRKASRCYPKESANSCAQA